MVYSQFSAPKSATVPSTKTLCETPSIIHNTIGGDNNKMNKIAIRLVGSVIVAALALVVTSMDQILRIVVSVVVGLPSFVLIIISRRQLGKSFSVMPEARVLVTTGLYSRIQHPMYVFLDLFLLAVIVALGWPILLLVWAILVAIQALQSRREEKLLAATFGTDYNSYRSRTWF